jgi:hypothetical protein
VSSEIFRDRSEGVNARRLELLRRRRDEFVMMPHAIRRVYVARRARSAASLAIWLMGIAMIVCALSPKLAAYVTKGMPGINPALLSTLVIAMWVVGIVAYFIARARCEHHFQVALSKTVLPSENPDEDIDRLSHEHPDEVARGMAHRLEVRASAWPIAAAAMIVPVTALYVLYGYKAHGWTAIADYEQALADNAGTLLFIAIAGAFAALVTTHRAFRKSSSLVWLMSAGTVSLRKERAMLETDDPAAGSEMVTWRAFIANLASTLEAIGTKLNKRQGRIALVAGVAAVATLGFMTGRRTHTAQPTPTATPTPLQARIAQPVPQQYVVNDQSGRSFMITSAGASWRIDVTLTDNNAVEIKLPGLAEVPAGWVARVGVVNDSTASLLVTTLSDLPVDDHEHLEARPIQRLRLEPKHRGTLTMRTCEAPAFPLGISLKGEPGTYVVYVTPVLEPAGC